jgi:hypothetical protein
MNELLDLSAIFGMDITPTPSAPAAIEADAPADAESAEVPSRATSKSPASKHPIAWELGSESPAVLRFQPCDQIAVGCSGVKIPRKSGLIGNSYPPIKPTVPDPRILATPKVVCPRCGVSPVLAELGGMTGGRCYGCWSTRDLSIAKSC